MKHNALHKALITSILLLAIFVILRSVEEIQDWLASPADQAVSTAIKHPLPFASEETAGELAVIVNREHPLPASYVPDDLTAPKIPFIFEGKHEKRLLRKPAALAVEKLFAAAHEDGIKLFGVSGFRSYETQNSLYAFNVRKKGLTHASRYSAVPGASEHQTGLAFDVTSESVNYRLLPAFANTKEGRWLAAHAHEFGFVIRYPEGKEDITGYAYEPWHIRFVGLTTAKTAHTYNMTLEELASATVPVFSQ